MRQWWLRPRHRLRCWWWSASRPRLVRWDWEKSVSKLSQKSKKRFHSTIFHFVPLKPLPTLRRRKNWMMGSTHSINRLWILSSYMSHVFEPSPQGVFLVVIFKVFVGSLTGPLTRRSFPLARSINSWQTFSRDATFLDVRVMRILWVFCAIVH